MPTVCTLLFLLGRRARYRVSFDVVEAALSLRSLIDQFSQPIRKDPRDLWPCRGKRRPKEGPCAHLGCPPLDPLSLGCLLIIHPGEDGRPFQIFRRIALARKHDITDVRPPALAD